MPSSGLVKRWWTFLSSRKTHCNYIKWRPDAGVTAIVDCGVAPGLSNLVLGYCDSIMKVDSFGMVGGLQKSEPGLLHTKPHSPPIDVLEEYTRPARYVENGHIITKPALSDPEFVDFEDIGTLQSFNTDGLRAYCIQ